MEYKYRVRHYHLNPALNESLAFKTKKDAVTEMHIMSSDEVAGGCSYLYLNETLLATRNWNKDRVSW